MNTYDIFELYVNGDIKAVKAAIKKIGWDEYTFKQQYLNHTREHDQYISAYDMRVLDERFIDDRILSFRVEGRNNYYAIDRYLGESCERHVDSFKTRKQANLTAGYLNNLAYEINVLKGSID